jgi:hypothetical protein
VPLADAWGFTFGEYWAVAQAKSGKEKPRGTFTDRRDVDGLERELKEKGLL